jgi:uncharacterized protein YaiL (DUF2058 family)
MRNPLQDQLLKAGLASQQQAKVINKQKQKQKTPEQQKPAESAAEAQAQRLARERELNEVRRQESLKKELAAQIRQLVQQHQLDPGRPADIAYHFAEQGKIKRIYVNQECLTRLERGLYALILFDERHFVIPAEIATRILERDPLAVITQATPPAAKPDAEDPYADYVIPDDLMW